MIYPSGTLRDTSFKKKKRRGPLVGPAGIYGRLPDALAPHALANDGNDAEDNSEIREDHVTHLKTSGTIPSPMIDLCSDSRRSGSGSLLPALSATTPYNGKRRTRAANNSTKSPNLPHRNMLRTYRASYLLVVPRSTGLYL